MNRSHVENDLAPLCQEFGFGLTVFSPLNYGILSGKYNNGIPSGSRATLDETAWLQERITPKAIEKIRSLTTIASDLGATTAQLAIAWVLRRKDISSVITGATRLEQLDENLASAELENKLDDEVLDAIDRVFGLAHDGS